MIEFKQSISDSDYRKAIAIHYFGYGYTYINPILGLILLLVVIPLIIASPTSLDYGSIILLVLGLFLMVRPMLYINNVFRSIKSNKMSPTETSIQITEDRIVITTQDNIESVHLRNLYAYCNKQTFLFLYFARNQYLVLDKRKMSQAQLEKAVERLEKLNIKRR